MSYITKLKKHGQAAGIRSGWNQHVEPYTARKAMKLVRRSMKREAVAQLGELLTFNKVVDGSSPSGPTNL